MGYELGLLLVLVLSLGERRHGSAFVRRRGYGLPGRLDALALRTTEAAGVRVGCLAGEPAVPARTLAGGDLDGVRARSHELVPPGLRARGVR